MTISRLLLVYLVKCLSKTVLKGYHFEQWTSYMIDWDCTIVPVDGFGPLLPNVEIVSLIFLVKVCESLSMILAPSQSMPWFWCVSANLWNSGEDSSFASADFLFPVSLMLMPNCFPVSLCLIYHNLCRGYLKQQALVWPMSFLFQ